MCDAEHRHRALVTRASGRDDRAMNELLERHLPGLVAFVRLHAGRRLLAHESSMDIVQSACLEVLQDLDQMRDQSEANFRHWLYVAVQRKILDRARFYGRARRDTRREVPFLQQLTDHQSARLLDVYASVTTPSQNAIAREELDRIEAAFARLPAQYRQVILLSRIVGLSHSQIARSLGRSEGATRILLHRALARLARCLDSPSAE